MPYRQRRPVLPATSYSYRRSLSISEMLPAIGAGIGIGVAAFYVARLFLQRTPLVREPGITRLDDRGAVVRRPRPGLRSR